MSSSSSASSLDSKSELLSRINRKADELTSRHFYYGNNPDVIRQRKQQLEQDVAIVLVNLQEEDLLYILRNREKIPVLSQTLLESLFIICQSETICKWIVENTYLSELGTVEFTFFIEEDEVFVLWKQKLAGKWVSEAQSRYFEQHEWSDYSDEEDN